MPWFYFPDTLYLRITLSSAFISLRNVTPEVFHRKCNRVCIFSLLFTCAIFLN